MSFTKEYLAETINILNSIKQTDLADDVEGMAQRLSGLRKSGGRLFILGVGGSSSTASHATNDFRKICNIETYCVTDNIAELTARTNDDGWNSVFVEWLKGSNFSTNDVILIFSVGGGDRERNISVGLCEAIDYAWSFGPSKVYGIVGKEGGYLAQKADIAIVIPPLYTKHITPHSEGIAGIVLHLLVSHPLLQKNKTKW